jgi:hypothetical protein
MDSNQSAWHRYHIDHKHDYADGYSNLSQSISTWGPYNLHHRLVYFALNFKPPRFTNQNVVAGFYDTTEQDAIKVGPGPFRGLIDPHYPILAVHFCQASKQEEH